jgi:hypothetical protein
MNTEGTGAQETPTAVDSQTNSQETRSNSTEFLYNRVQSLRAELEDTRTRLEQIERKIGPFEEFMGKAKQLFEGFFRKKGVNIDSQHQVAQGNQEITRNQYLANRPEENAEELNKYRTRLENMNLSPEEIEARMNRITGTMTEEQKDVAVNVDPAHQRTEMQHRDVTWDEYKTQRESLEQRQKGMITEAGGVTPEVAQKSAQLRERLQKTAQPQTPEESREAERRKVNPEEKARFQQAQANVQAGVNKLPENQINKEELTVGETIDQKLGATPDNLRSMANLIEQQDNPNDDSVRTTVGNNNSQPDTSKQN